MGSFDRGQKLKVSILASNQPHCLFVFVNFNDEREIRGIFGLWVVKNKYSIRTLSRRHLDRTKTRDAERGGLVRRKKNKIK